MISLTEQLTLSDSALRTPHSALLSPELAARVHENDLRLVAKWREWLCAPVETLKPSEWIEQSVTLNIAAARNKRWTFEGREYSREPIDQIENPECRMLSRCMGTGSSKTSQDYVIALYEMRHNPFSGLYIMPASTGPGGATAICRELQQTLEASADVRFHPTPPFAGRLPVGAAKKTSLTRTRIEFGGNDLDFVGAHSANQVGNKRCRLVFLGEQDKTKEQLGREAGTDYLAGERIKGMSNTKIIRGSTPSLEGFGIWKALMGNGDSSGSDCRRRFLPCPHCNPVGRRCRDASEADRQVCPTDLKGWFVLIKDAQYNTALPTKIMAGGAATTPIPFAELRWDKEAKRKDGTWDMDRVIKSTRFECPHCGGHVRDEHRLWLDKNGVWIPTRRGEPGHFGYQLASFYAPLVTDDYGQINFDSTWGGMAQKFLNAIENGTIGGYINSDLAEVNANQNNAGGRIELTSQPLAQPDWIPVLTADYHKNHPYLWFVARKWCGFKLLSRPGITEGRPEFVAELDAPENHAMREICGKLIGFSGDVTRLTKHASPVWNVIGELSRFNSTDPSGRSALIDFLLAQKITGEALLKFFSETAGSDTMEFRRRILLEMWQQSGGDEKKFRAARGGDSELIAAGYCDRSGEYAWEELTDIITEFKIGQGLKIPLRAVAVDCGFSQYKERIVLQKCHESATEFDYYDPTIRGKEPFFSDRKQDYSQLHGWNGWQAIRGKPTFQSQGSGLGRDLGKHTEDPFYGTAQGGTTVVDILEIPTALFWLRKDDIRQKRTKQIATVSPHVSLFPKRYLPDGTRTEESNYRIEDYERQSNMMILDEKKGVIRSRAGTGGGQSKRHPDHVDDCETYQVALATHLEFFETTAKS